MSKMGISVISSYRGGCNFEAVGLSRAIVSDYFPGMSSRISGIGVIGIEKKLRNFMLNLMRKMYSRCLLEVSIDTEKVRRSPIPRKINSFIQNAVGSGSYEQYKKYSAGINNLPPINLRDLLEFKKSKKEISY